MELGGAESHIITLSKALKDEGHMVSIASSFGPAVENIINLGIQFYEFDLTNEDLYISNAEKVIQIIENEKIDIIHCHPFHSQIIASLIKMVKNIPIVSTIHGPYIPNNFNKIKHYIDRFIFISEETYFFYKDRNLINNRSVIINNCVPVYPLVQSNSNFESELKILYVSRLDDDKYPSITFFIKALEEACGELNLKVTIVGRGTKYFEILDTINRINEKYNKAIFNLINGATDVRSYMEQHDVIVGVGRVLLEGLSAKKICICIGNSNYVGIINREKLIQISKVNFTDRNTNITLSNELFIKDLKNIFTNKDEIYSELEDTFHYFKDHYDIATSARKHSNLYYEVQKECETKHKYFDNFNIKYLENIEFALELKSNGFNYVFNNAKKYTYLLVPDFFDMHDRWKVCIEDIMNKGIMNNDSTIVIRITNEFHHNIENIIHIIEDTIGEVAKQIDILIDCEYLDDIMEILLLSEVDYFIPTNEKQQLYQYYCRLMNAQIISNNFEANKPVVLHL